MYFTQKSSDPVLLSLFLLVMLSLTSLIFCSESKFVDPVVSDPDFKVICGSCDQGRQFVESDTLSGIVSIKVDGPFAPDMKQVRLFIDDVLVDTGRYLKLDHRWNTTEAIDGSTHTLYAIILDEQGAGVRTETIAVILRGTAPAKIVDLVATPIGTNSIMLRWTAPGDDGDSGRATAYEIKWGLERMPDRYRSYLPIDNNLIPSPAGQIDSFSVSGIPSNSSFVYSVTAVDEVSNQGELSNIAIATTDPILELVDSVNFPYSISFLLAGDLNGDNYPDIVMVEQDQAVHVMLNNGLGGFGTAETYVAGDHIMTVLLVDIDLDFDLDIVTNDVGSQQFTALLNDGSGNFDSTIATFKSNSSFSIAMGDINGDSLPDLVASEVYKDSVSFFINAGGGEFDLPYNMFIGSESYTLNLTDMTGDGITDLLLALPGMPRIYTGDNSGSFEAYYEVPYTGVDPIVFDFDSDGDLDILLDAKRIIYNNNGGFYISDQTGLPSGTSQFVGYGDFDSDGLFDFVRAGTGDLQCFYLAQSKQDKGFYDVTSYGPQGQAGRIVTADFDGDGRVEIAVASFNRSLLIFRSVE